MVTRSQSPSPIAAAPSAAAPDAAARALSTRAPSLDESAALLRACEGDLDAFDQLVALHQNRVFNACYWMLGNRDDAADAAQDAFVRAFRSIETFRGDSAFSTWLHRIAVNASLDVMQRRKRAPRPYSDLDSSGENALDSDVIEAQRDANDETASTPSNDPALVAARSERRRAVREALAKLPEHYRTSLVLFDIEGHSYDEIARALKLPIGTIKSRINRARASLREQLESARELFDS